MEQTKQITVDKNGVRLDVFLAENLNFSRSKVQKLIDNKKVLIGGEVVKSKHVISIGEVISVTIPEPEEYEVKPINIPIEVVYQDDALAVINKPQGLTVHKGSGTGDDTLVNALLYHLDKLSGINGVIRPGIVHRIDKDTSGLLVVAKNDIAHLKLSNQIEKKICKRVYIALLEGNLKSDNGRVETYISRSTKNRTMMAVSSSGRKAITDYKVIERCGGYTLCEFSLQTGRTHQIRVHSKHLGHPIVGDLVYGYKANKFKLNGQLLHAKTLSFIHPTLNEEVTFSAKIPDYFTAVLIKLGFTKF